MKLLVIGILSVTLASLSAWSQEQKMPLDFDQREGYVVNVDVQFVQFSVSVVNKDGRAVTGLIADQFKAFEDGVEQSITAFAQEDGPISLGIVVDNSSSMTGNRQGANQAAVTFLRESHPNDETFIVKFDNDVFLEQDFTGSADAVARALKYSRRSGQTALYDAVYLSADHMRKGRRDQKVILLISDGEDTASRYDLNETIEMLQESQVTVYAIGLFHPLQHGGNVVAPPSGKAKRVLRKISQATGGEAYFPKSANELEDMCMRINRHARSRYTIGYSPLNTSRDGSWRNIGVKVAIPDTKVIVRTKLGYYAPRLAMKDR